MIVKVKDSKNRKWEPKKKVQFQGAETIKVHMHDKKLEPNIIKQVVGPTTQVALAPRISIKPTIYDPIDMISMLSHIVVKFALSKMFRIKEHKNKALSWLSGIGNSNLIEKKSTFIHQTPIIIEDKGVMSQIPQMYLDNSYSLPIRHRPFLPKFGHKW